MTAFSCSRADIFPPGTKVRAFTVPKPEPAELEKLKGSPATWRYGSAAGLAEVGEAEVDANCKLEFGDGVLTTGQKYVLYAKVGEADRYLYAIGS